MKTKTFSYFALATLFAVTDESTILAQNQTKTVLKSESFDRDPGWDGVNNRVKVEKPIHVIQDFGFSATQHAGGKAPGEIGGRVQRSTTPAFYGMRLEKPQTFDNKLHCSGSFAVTDSGGLSGIYFGWFNTKTPANRPYNWMGFCLSGGKTGCEVHVGYRTGLGVAGGPGRVTGSGPNRGSGVRDFNRIPNDTRYTFDFLYDPDGGGGAGEIVFTLGGEGPFTGGPFKFKLPPDHRKIGATFDAFGIINPLAAGGSMAAWFDDLTINGRAEPFDRDPQWLAQNNRAEHDDYGLKGSHQFGFSDTAFAGGQRGELGGLIFSSAATPGYYGDKVGRLTLDHPLTASGRIALREYGSDSGVYLGWFDSAKRGHPPANILGVLIDGPTSAAPRFRGCVASSDPKVATPHRRETAAPIAPDGASRMWKITYQPDADDGRGRMTVWLDNHKDEFVLPPELRKVGATFDRFGLFVHEGGGTASRIYLDDLKYTATRPAK